MSNDGEVAPGTDGIRGVKTSIAVKMPQDKQTQAFNGGASSPTHWAQANHHHDQKPFKTSLPQQVVSFGVPATTERGDQNDSAREHNLQYLDQVITPANAISKQLSSSDQLSVAKEPKQKRGNERYSISSSNCELHSMGQLESEEVTN